MKEHLTKLLAGQQLLTLRRRLRVQIIKNNILKSSTMTLAPWCR